MSETSAQSCYKRGALTKFATFTGNTVAGLNACNFIKKTPRDLFSCEYCETFKNTILKNICDRLLLKMCQKHILCIQKT